MNNPSFQPRFYRHWTRGARLHGLEVAVKETDLHILSDTPVDRAYCLKRIAYYRSQIEFYINERDSRFLTALKPMAVEKSAPAIVRSMAAAAARADVGPMAAVAGGIAERVGRDLLRKGCREVIVENGGDIFLSVRHAVEVGIFAGESSLSGKLRLRITPGQTPGGLCTSSGTVGHSISFGRADAMIIFARTAALADAVATAAGNRVQSPADLPQAIAFARSVAGVRGVLAVIGSHCASWGELELCAGANAGK